MKRTGIVLAILATLAGLLVTSSALARRAAKVVTVKHFVCSEAEGKRWPSGGMLHLRGFSNRGQLVFLTEPPDKSLADRLAGSSTIIFNADLNDKTMAGVGYGTAVFLPAANSTHGTWQGTFKEQNPATPDQRTGTAFLRGTDDLKGLELTITIKGTAVTGAPALCPNPTAADIMTMRVWSTR